jgi:hypothetical protein
LKSQIFMISFITKALLLIMTINNFMNELYIMYKLLQYKL